MQFYKTKKHEACCKEDGVEMYPHTPNSDKKRLAHKCELNGYYGSLRHEMGHYLDRKNGWISSNDKAFNDAIENFKITDEHKKDLKLFGKYYYNGPISDIFDAISNGTVYGGFAHGRDYYEGSSFLYGDSKKKQLRNTEIFANMTNAYACKDRSHWNEMKKLFPDITKAYEDIITRLSA